MQIKSKLLLKKDNWIKVTDNGRGIPVDIQEKWVVQQLKLS